MESVAQLPGGKNIALVSCGRLRSVKETRRDDHHAFPDVLKSYCQHAGLAASPVKSPAMLDQVISRCSNSFSRSACCRLTPDESVLTVSLHFWKSKGTSAADRLHGMRPTPVLGSTSPIPTVMAHEFTGVSPEEPIIG